MEHYDLTPAERWERATLADNFIFYKVMRHHPGICRRLLELLLDMDIEHVEMAQEETIALDPGSRSVRLDVYARSGDRAFDIEVQVADTGELPERARYYQGIMDVDLLASGQPYRDLKESHVIFICMADVFGRGLPVYTFENRCLEDGSIGLGDRTHKHFFIAPLCATLLEKGERRSFFELLTGGAAGTELTGTLEALVADAKHNTQWRMQYMTWERQQFYAHEAGYKQGEQSGFAKGEQAGIRDVARRMLAEGLPLEQVAHLTQLAPEELRALQATVK